MNEAQLTTYLGAAATSGVNRLPSAEREHAAERKYAEAVQMYARTDLTIRRVAELCGVTPSGLSAHIGRHHRGLLLARYGLDDRAGSQDLQVKPPKGQSPISHLKYKDAIAACADLAYIEFNVSQVARMFRLNGTALASQMRVHFPDIIPQRESLRRRLGIADAALRGARQASVDSYAAAVEAYRDSDLTIAEAADLHNVSRSGLGRFLRFFHRDIIEIKAARRKAAKKEARMRTPGTLAANGNLYGPKPETEALYARALELYRTTPLTIAEIAEKAEVPAAGFKGYLSQWHRADMALRGGDGAPCQEGARRRLKSTAAKYAPAIASLKANPRSVAEAAAQFGLNADVFRQYLKSHEPQLAASMGMAVGPGGKRVKRSASEKYARAISEYATTAEPLKSIALRHGIPYKSISGYVARNCPQERMSHRRLAINETQPTTE